MKIQLDTKAKVIRLEDKVLLKDLVVTLEKLLPKKEWHTFTLETDTVINGWSLPIITREYKPWTYPWYISENTHYANGENNKVGALADGSYNIEC